MNNDLEKFSEERLKEMVKFCEPSIHGLSKHFETPEVAALARIVLAAKQAKPVVDIEPLATAIMKTIDAETDKFHSAYTLSELRIAIVKTLSALTTPQPTHTEQAIKITQVMLDAAVADYCTTGKYTVENIPYELRRQVEFEAESTFKAMLAAAPKPESE